MLRRITINFGSRYARSTFELQRNSYSERRRRKGDGTKTDIFEERSAASQDEYFRRETARQLRKLREKAEQAAKKKNENGKPEEPEESKDKKKNKPSGEE